MPHPDDEGDGMPGCGKAEALARRGLLTDDGGTVAYAEAFDDTDVIHYQLDIEITNIDPVNNQCTITGNNRIRVRSQVDGLTEFTFRLRNQFVISSAVVNDETAAVSVVVDTISETTRVATLDRAYAAGEEFTIKIDYSGDTLSLGLGSIEVANQPFGAPIVSSLSEPYFAYTWWPAKHEDVGQPGDNADKATIEFSITVPDNFDVPSNGLLQSVDVLAGNRLRYNWATVNPIATYLVSFAAGEFNRWTESYVYPGGSMPVEFYIYPGNDTPQNRQSWSDVVDMLGVFASLFGEYPFVDEKYGIYNFPFGGGMEHQTMTGQGTFSEITTAHEAAHQWWGDLVTCKTWSDIWLNEGFASYGECLWREFESGTPNHSAYLSRVLQRKPQNVDSSVYVYPEILSLVRIFSSTYSYNKGCWVLHQLRHVVGDETFFQILANYRSAYANSAATTDDFAAVASTTFGEDLTWFFDQWVYQIGAPAYEYAWDNINVGGQDFLLAQVRQVQEPEYPDVFTAPLDLVVGIDFGPQETLTVWNDQREQWFAIPVGGTVTSLQFDPDQWVLRTGAVHVAYGLTPGDFDGDGDVDTTDATTMRQCLADSDNFVPVGCEAGDFNNDGTIDCDDWDQFGLVWMEAGDPPPAIQCLGIAPAVSTWGLVVLVLVMLVAATVTIDGRQTRSSANMSR